MLISYAKRGCRKQNFIFFKILPWHFKTKALGSTHIQPVPPALFLCLQVSKCNSSCFWLLYLFSDRQSFLSDKKIVQYIFDFILEKNDLVQAEGHRIWTIFLQGKILFLPRPSAWTNTFLHRTKSIMGNDFLASEKFCVCHRRTSQWWLMPYPSHRLDILFQGQNQIFFWTKINCQIQNGFVQDKRFCPCQENQSLALSFCLDKIILVLDKIKIIMIKIFDPRGLFDHIQNFLGPISLKEQKKLIFSYGKVWSCQTQNDLCQARKKG